MTDDKTITVKDVLLNILASMGADGLVNPELECGCSIFDFEPCGECNLSECLPARKKKDENGEEFFYPMQP